MRFKGPRVFIIGVNRCGTTSLHRFFERNGCPSVHWGGPLRSENLVACLAENFRNGQPLLTGFEQFQVFSDFTFQTFDEHINTLEHFQDLHTQYPESLFILNTRSTDTWLVSRLRFKNLVERAMSSYGADLLTTIALWRTEKESHEARVREYFKDYERFLEFDIERNTAAELVGFLSRFIPITDPALPRINETI
jgi:hypothetical protein